MRALLVLLLLGITVFGQDLPPKPPKHEVLVANSCVLYAVEYQNILQAKALIKPSFCRIVSLHYENHREWHAYCVFKLRERWYAFSVQKGTFELKLADETLPSIAKAIEAWEHANLDKDDDYFKNKVIEAAFMD